MARFAHNLDILGWLETQWSCLLDCCKPRSCDPAGVESWESCPLVYVRCRCFLQNQKWSPPHTEGKTGKVIHIQYTKISYVNKLCYQLNATDLFDLST